jgi:hypothetical protein
MKKINNATILLHAEDIELMESIRAQLAKAYVTQKHRLDGIVDIKRPNARREWFWKRLIKELRRNEEAINAGESLISVFLDGIYKEAEAEAEGKREIPKARPEELKALEHFIRGDG